VPVVRAWQPGDPTTAGKGLTLEALKNAEYQGIYDEPVQLTDGKYEGEPFVPGGASRPTVVLHPEVYVFGDLNGDGVDDAAVILIESSGGSGNFRYLAAVINERGTPVNVATHFVGDREQMQAINIDEGEITLDMVAHAPEDPMCCPTQEVTKVYQLQDDQLIEVLVALEGTLWTLVSYGDPSDPQAVLEGSEITAEFDSVEGTVSGSAGCNGYFGSYEVDGETIIFGLLGSTLMACAEPEGIMEQEVAYLAVLGSAGTYRIEGDKLDLVDADGTRVAQFIALPPASLASTEWILTAYSNGQDAVVSVLMGTEITAAFGDDGRLAGSAGCNTYGASYEVDGDHITFGPAVTTRMWCAEPDGIMDQENAFLAALGLAATYHIQGDKLEMRNADGALALQFTAKSTEVAAGEAYIVQSGDWLTKIARNFYGDADAYRLIVEATNAKAAEDASFTVIDNPSLIRAGQKLWIPAQPGSLTLEALQNASYQGIYDEAVQLTDGLYEGEPFVPGGASRPTVVLHPEVYAFGDLNDDGVDDAVVILIESSGGSGSFIYLAAVINESGAPVNVATYFVGDREQMQSITIKDGEITLDMVAHGPDDPMCCPTQEVTKRYRLQGDQLIEL
jgi:heat shock protein HslJ